MSFDAGKDYYSILGISREDAGDTWKLKRCYHKLALKFHPDKTGKRDCEYFKVNLEAYEVLRDSSLKSEYDNARSSYTYSYYNHARQSQTSNDDDDGYEDKTSRNTRSKAKSQEKRRREQPPRKARTEQEKKAHQEKQEKARRDKANKARRDKAKREQEKARKERETKEKREYENARRKEKKAQKEQEKKDDAFRSVKREEKPEEDLRAIGVDDRSQDAPIWNPKNFPFETYFEDDYSETDFLSRLQRAVVHVTARCDAAIATQQKALKRMRDARGIDVLPTIQEWRDAEDEAVMMKKMRDRAAAVLGDHRKRAGYLKGARKSLETKRARRQAK